MSSRVLGMVTFCDGNEGESINTVKSGGVEISRLFKFNNSHVFEYIDDDKLNEKFFRDAIGNYEELCNFILEEAKPPVSMKLTKQMIDHRDKIASQESTVRSHCIALSGLRATISSKLHELKSISE